MSLIRRWAEGTVGGLQTTIVKLRLGTQSLAGAFYPALDFTVPNAYQVEIQTGGSDSTW